jgi:FHA domain
MSTPILKREYTFGRIANMNDIHLDSKKVSQKHAKISFIENGNLLLEDLNSSNGTYVNDEQIKTKLVNITDTIKMGDKQFVLSDFFRLDSDKKRLEFRGGSGTNDFTREFLLLKPIAEKYFEDVENHTKKNERIKFLQKGMILVSPLLGILGAKKVSEGQSQLLNYFFALPTLIAIFVFFKSETPKAIEKTKQYRKLLDDDFRKIYVCPKCKAPFPISKTWEEIAVHKVHNTKENQCGAIWVK